MYAAKVAIAALLITASTAAWAAAPTETPKDADKDNGAKCEPGKCKCGKCGTSECKCHKKDQHAGCPGHQK